MAVRRYPIADFICQFAATKNSPYILILINFRGFIPLFHFIALIVKVYVLLKLVVFNEIFLLSFFLIFSFCIFLCFCPSFLM